MLRRQHQQCLDISLHNTSRPQRGKIVTCCCTGLTISSNLSLSSATPKRKLIAPPVALSGQQQAIAFLQTSQQPRLHPLQLSLVIGYHLCRIQGI